MFSHVYTHRKVCLLALPHEAKPYIVLKLPFLPNIAQTVSVHGVLFYTHLCYFVIQVTHKTAHISKGKVFVSYSTARFQTETKYYTQEII